MPHGARRESRCLAADWTVGSAFAALLPAAAAQGAWLESPLEAELPIDPPKHGYPTAVRASISDDADPETQSRRRCSSQRTDATAARSPSLQLTPLAVIPPQYVQMPLVLRRLRRTPT